LLSKLSAIRNKRSFGYCTSCRADLAKRSRAAQPDVAIRIMLAQFVQRAQNALFGFPAILREG